MQLGCPVQIVAIHSGVFVAVIQLKAQGSSEPVSVEVQPHSRRRPMSLWVGSSASEGGRGIIWQRLSALASRALCYYRDRARLSGVRYPGAASATSPTCRRCAAVPLEQSRSGSCRWAHESHSGRGVFAALSQREVCSEEGCSCRGASDIGSAAVVCDVL